MPNRLYVPFRREVLVGPERLAFFGDAVFAIAITLLALDISVPEDLPDSDVAHAVREAVPAIGAYLLSFLVIGALWLAQHALFRLIATIDRWLLFCYFALLAIVAALPFPTKLISEYGDTTTGTAFYAASIFLTVVLYCAMYLRLIAKPGLTAPHATPSNLTEVFRRSLVVALVFATSVPVAFFSPTLAKYWWLLAVPANLLFRARPAAASGGQDESQPSEG
ncbi:TMEM175 family protein [Streptomyces sp. NBC_00588]|uniref:TMEM175 family protein n=1 Tax=Streptomyces sp. NBC_00588 TaxID=2975784 RepID=UPI002E81482E|nr:TMEM175 family protein [Streptomyces sp. NBC_00588]WUB40727.1 TMEM175 family protein [Streptomyces sp. NBC_00588]